MGVQILVPDGVLTIITFARHMFAIPKRETKSRAPKIIFFIFYFLSVFNNNIFIIKHFIKFINPMCRLDFKRIFIRDYLSVDDK